tara:strand:- start:691 stop:984 length:294 start_codon:yes stop_codon:yes gene_type:complete
MGVTPSFLLKKISSRNKINLINYQLNMSREELKIFVKCLENNILLKDKLIECKTSEDLILLAKKYGFKVTLEDFKYDKTATKFEFWFKKSIIKTLKY